MKNTKIFEKKSLLIVCVCLICFMIIGSFFDYQISSTLFNSKSLFGLSLAGYGQLPAMLCMSISGALLIVFVKSLSLVKKAVGYFFGALLSVFAVMMVTLDPIINIKGMPVLLSLVIAVIIIAAVDVLALQLTRHTQRQDIKKVIILLIATMFLNMLIINIVKIPWGRPRMRMIAVTPDAMFQPWWIIGSQAKEHFMALGVVAEEFKSFPSGHSGNAACAMLIGVLPLLNSYFKGKENLLFFSGFAFALLVALSRIIMGAHFLTDITVGITVTFVVEVVMVWILWKRGEKQNG